MDRRGRCVGRCACGVGTVRDMGGRATGEEEGVNCAEVQLVLKRKRLVYILIGMCVCVCPHMMGWESV